MPQGIHPYYNTCAAWAKALQTAQLISWQIAINSKMVRAALKHNHAPLLSDRSFTPNNNHKKTSGRPNKSAKKIHPLQRLTLEQWVSWQNIDIAPPLLSRHTILGTTPRRYPLYNTEYGGHSSQPRIIQLGMHKTTRPAGTLPLKRELGPTQCRNIVHDGLLVAFLQGN